MYNTNTEVVQYMANKVFIPNLINGQQRYLVGCVRKHKFMHAYDSPFQKDSIASSLFNPNASYNNNISKRERRVSAMAALASPSIKSYGGRRKTSKQVIAVVHNPSFRYISDCYQHYYLLIFIGLDTYIYINDKFYSNFRSASLRHPTTKTETNKPLSKADQFD